MLARTTAIDLPFAVQAHEPVWRTDHEHIEIHRQGRAAIDADALRENLDMFAVVGEKLSHRLIAGD
jgi:hypothetical protein